MATHRFYGPNGEVDTFGVGVTRVRGGSGNDTLVGDSGDNQLDGGAGNDDLSGFGGQDQVSYARHSAAVRATLDGKINNGAAGEADRIRPDAEGLIGSNFNDALTGNGGSNTLRGLYGANC